MICIVLDASRYVDDDEGLKKYFAAFHMHEVFPAVVIIDDFGEFFDERYTFLLVYPYC